MSKNTKRTKVTIVQTPLVRPEKKKELEAFWNSITLENINLLTEEDYAGYRRWVAKKKVKSRTSTV